MDEEEMSKVLGLGEPIDQFTAASLGFLQHIHSDTPAQGEYQREGWSRLMYAVYYGRTGVIQVLAEGEGLTSGRCTSTQPLCHLLVLSAHLPTTFKLLISKEMLEEKDCQDRTALYLAVETEQTDLVNHLLLEGAAVNTICRGKSCLSEAARRGNCTLIELLLEYGARVALPQQIDSALNLAFQSGNMKAVNTLITHIVNKHGLEELFKQIKLEKYWTGLRQSGVGLKELLAMSETDLKNSGVRALGPRKKLACLISLLANSQ